MAVEAMVLACRDTRFFVTGNEYFGLGPPDIQVGDEVHVLSGTSVPFVLKTLEGDNKESGIESHSGSVQETFEMVDADGMGLYSMVGEAYIHGYMQGQGQGGEWEGICIW